MPSLPIQKSGVDLNTQRMEMVAGDLRPMGDRLIVKPLPLKLSEHVIALWGGKTVVGQVVASGKGEYPNIYNKDRSKVWKSKVFRPNECKVGDIVYLGGMENGGYSFPVVSLNGEDHIVCSQKDVCGIQVQENPTL
jgi:hypothetical protein